MKYSLVRNFIDGKFINSSSGKTLEVISPVDGTLLSKVCLSSSQDLDEAVVSAKKAFVWIKKDSALLLHSIRTGMDDETEVQVLSGLDSTDVVVTGYTQQKTTAKAAKPQTSPFMPQRPGNRNQTKKSTASRPS